MIRLAFVLLVACTPAPRATSPLATGTSWAAPRAVVDHPRWPFGVRVVGHGPPMILIPGMATSGAVWDATVEHEQARFTCHVIELPGFAGRPAIAAPMLATVRDALVDYLRVHRLERPVIVGHSLGGFVALDLARREPGLVGKLVIVDAQPFLPAAFDASATVATMQAAAPAIRAGMAADDADAFERRQRATLATMIRDPAQQALALSWAMRSDRTAIVDAWIELMTTDLRPALATITAPTLVIETWRGWDTDRATVERAYAAQYANLRGAKRVMADAAKHFVMLDDPAFWYAQLDAFVP